MKSKTVAKNAGKIPKPNNVITIPTSLDKDFFKWWCVFLKPFVNLTNREVDVISSFLKHRYELSKVISDPTTLDAVLMSKNMREKVASECNLTIPHYYVVMNKLKKNKVIIDSLINPRLIPNIREDDEGCFKLLILFKDDTKKNGL